MREIVLDTETTGLDPADGHRIVEIGAIELLNFLPTGRTFHVYINPQRDMPAEALAVHGLDTAFLADKPVFAAIADDFAAFIDGARLVIHNAAFDIRFLNAELSRTGHASLRLQDAIDTLMVARQRFPGSPASLDALCRRFGVDTSVRVKHGALLDCELLAEVYLELVGGRQPDFALAPNPDVTSAKPKDQTPGGPVGIRPRALASRLSASESQAHAAMITALGEGAIWKKIS
jgi:DNA polymerase-3 subunit epsilon